MNVSPTRRAGMLAAPLVMVMACAWTAGEDRAMIDIWKENPAYWSYGGQPVLLLGGSVEDNLFQIDDLDAHLDLLKSVGGNYVRNTMSSRDEGNVWPFKRLDDGRYDLDGWSDEFWRRFDHFLEATDARDIIVQIEVWATFDYYRDNWEVNPFNPKNNVNYTAEDSGLPLAVPSHPVRTGNNFFWSVPAERNQKNVLHYQQRFVDKMLSYSLRHGNILYCMDNETSVTPAWGAYWSEYIKAKAAEAGVKVHTTEMWDAHDLANPMHNATFDHPETYSFVDVSQNNHQKGQRHWDNAQVQRARVAKHPRPMNNTKIYGADTGHFGDTRHGLERFWRNILGGMASARHHRPPSGLGLNELAQANIRSLRMATDAMDFFAAEPHNDLLSDREENEAYCRAEPGRAYLTYFPNGGSVTLDLSAAPGDLKLRWLKVMESAWQGDETIQGGGAVALAAPSADYWAVLIQRSE